MRSQLIRGIAVLAGLSLHYIKISLYNAGMEKLVTALKAAGEPTRLRILALLGQGELTVNELVQVLDQSQPRVSRHLKLLAEAGLIERCQEGTWVFCRLADRGPNAALLRVTLDMLPADDEALARDHKRLAQVRSARASSADAYFRANATEWNRIRSLYVPEAEVETVCIPSTYGQRYIVRGLKNIVRLHRKLMHMDLTHKLLTVTSFRLQTA